MSGFQRLSIKPLIINLGSCQVWAVVNGVSVKTPIWLFSMYMISDVNTSGKHHSSQLPAHSIKMLNFVAN